MALSLRTYVPSALPVVNTSLKMSQVPWSRSPSIMRAAKKSKPCELIAKPPWRISNVFLVFKWYAMAVAPITLAACALSTIPPLYMPDNSRKAIVWAKSARPAAGRPIEIENLIGAAIGVFGLFATFFATAFSSFFATGFLTAAFCTAGALVTNAAIAETAAALTGAAFAADGFLV